MKKYYYLISIFLLLIPAVLLQPDVYAKEKVSMTFFSYASGKFSMEPVYKGTTYYLPLKGKTSLGLIVVQIKKTGSRSLKVYPEIKNGTFNAVYLFVEGKGDYTITIYGHPLKNSRSFQGLCRFSVNVRGDVPGRFKGPYLNKKVLDYVDSVMGKRVRRGECWDLAQVALDMHGATWRRPVNFGRLIDPAKEDVKPGDIIQFRSVRITEYKADGSVSWETLGSPDHTAVIYKVLGSKHYDLAHQNVMGKRHVLRSPVNLNKMTSGMFWIYRPVAGLVDPGLISE